MNNEKQYQKSIHRLGKISLILAFLWFFAVPIIVCARYNIFPTLKVFINASLSLFLVLTPIALSEIISFVPLLGSGASYLSFITGNVSNLKLPCAMNALKLAEVSPGTDEAEVLSTISVAVSSITTTFIIILGVILLVPLSSFFSNTYVVTATANILPALFGALVISFIGDNSGPVKGQWKASILPFILVAVIHYFVFPISGFEGVAILIMIPVTLLWARFLYKKGQIRVLGQP